MDYYSKRLMKAFLVLFLIKVAMSLFINSPTQFVDEYWYQRMAQSFFRDMSFLIDEKSSGQYMPLYPIFLSLSFIFSNMEYVYAFMKIINSFLSSAVIFPAFLIAKEFMNKKKAFKIAILISLIPSMFGFFPYILSENLFYPLFLFAIYFIYKALEFNNIKFTLLAGLFIGVCSLVKVTGLFLIFIVFISFFIKLIQTKDKSIIYNFFIIFCTAIFTFSIWLIRNWLVFGFLENNLGSYQNDVITTTYKLSSDFLLPVSLLFMSNLAYIVISSLIIFFIYAMFSYKKGNYSSFYILSWTTIFTFLFLISLYGYKLHGQLKIYSRYFAQTMPLIVIMGFIGLKNKYSKKANILLIVVLSFLFLVAGSLFLKNRLYPTNNFDLSYLGILIDLIPRFYFILFLVLLPATLLYLRNLSTKRLYYFAVTVFILLNLLNYSITFYNSNYRWDNCSFMALGKEFNKLGIKDKVIAFENDINKDIRKVSLNDPCIVAPADTGAFWINNKVIRFYDKNTFDGIDYFVTTKEINFEKILEKDNIKIYKTNLS